MATFAEDQLARIEALLARNPGVRQISFEGVTVAYDDLVKQRDYWLNQVAREQGKRTAIIRVDLGGF